MRLYIYSVELSLDRVEKRCANALTHGLTPISKTPKALPTKSLVPRVTHVYKP